MGLFDRFRRPKRTCVDPTSGPLEFDERFALWSGDVPFPPTGEVIWLHLESDGSEPGEAYRTLFSEFVRRYATLRPTIGGAMFDEWKFHLDHWHSERAPVGTTVDELVKLTNLEGLSLAPPSRLDLSYAFVDEVGWPDAVLSVELTDWRVTDSSIDD